MIGGQLCAFLALFVLQQRLLTPEKLRDWGGGLLSIFAAVMRSNLSSLGLRIGLYLPVSTVVKAELFRPACARQALACLSL